MWRNRLIELSLLSGFLVGVILAHFAVYPRLRAEKLAHLYRIPEVPSGVQMIGEVISSDEDSTSIRAVSLFPDASTLTLTVQYDGAKPAVRRSGSTDGSAPRPGDIVTFTLARAEGPLKFAGPISVHEL